MYGYGAFWARRKRETASIFLLLERTLHGCGYENGKLNLKKKGGKSIKISFDKFKVIDFPNTIEGISEDRSST